MRAALGISDVSDERYNGIDGSCQWIDARDDFCDWRDAPFDYNMQTATKSKTISMFWVHAHPGTGKTVLASHVVSHLQELRLECASHYFHSGDKTSSSLAMLLRSIAYQMAETNAAICDKLFMLAREGLSFALDDSRAIWLKLFKKGIFQVSSRASLAIILCHWSYLAVGPFVNDADMFLEGRCLLATVLGH